MNFLNKYKFNGNSVTKVMLFVLGFLFISMESKSQDLLNIKQSSIFYVSSGATLQVNGTINIDNGGTLTQSADGYSRIYLNGNFAQNGTFNAGVGAMVFNYSATTEITSGSSITFNQIVIDKTNPTDQVIFNTDFTVVNDTINSGTQSMGADDDWIFNITNNLVVNSNGTLTAESGSSDHILNLSKNLIVENGTLNLINSGSKIDINLIGNGNVSISGSSTSGSINFSEVTINKDNATDTVTLSRSITSPTATGFLNMTRGTFNISGTENFSAALFKANSNLVTIGSNSRVLFNNANFTLTGQDADILLDGGRINLTTGTLNIGNGGSRGNFYYNNNAQFTQTGGIVNVTKSFARDLSNDAASITFVKSAGIFRAGAERSSLSTRGVFDLGSTGSQITWTGGDIEILKNSSSFSNGDYYVRAAALNGGVTGGNLYFAPNTNTTSEIEFKINSTRFVYNLTMLDNSGAASPQLEQVESNLLVLHDLTLVGRGYVQSASQLELQGNFTNNANTGYRFDPKTNTVLFSGSASNQTIQSLNDTILFYNFHIQKTNGTTVTTSKPLTIGSNLRLINSNILKMGDHNLRIKLGGGIFANSIDVLGLTTGMDGLSDKFSQNKFIEFSGTLSTGTLIREVNSNPVSGSTVYYYRYPFGTPGYYSGIYVKLRRTETSVAVGAEINVKPIASQHPDITEPNIALRKYFNIQTTGMTIAENSYTIKFESINLGEIQGNIDNYEYVFFRTQGNWYDNPNPTNTSGKTLLSSTVYSFQLDEVSFDYLDGDWTAGPRSAVEAIYYSIANGPWDSVGTWSRVGYGQVAASSYPTSNLDLVYIGDGKTVTLETIAPELRGVYVQNTGRLNIAAGAYIEPALDEKDTLSVEAGGTLGIADPNGIAEVAATGNVRNTTRIFSSQGKYAYNGITNQSTGDGLPNTVGALIIENTGSLFGTDSTVTLSKATEIKDSLVINNGKFNIVTTTCDGEIPNRTFIMRGGEIAVATFPTKYSSPTFTGGIVNFAGTSAFTIPSSNHPNTPVNQYYTLKISAQVGSNSNITLDPTGEIKITKEFNISELDFDPVPNSQRILVSGSTVHFNGTGDQTIPSGYDDARELVYRLNYDNIKISGSGIKTLGNPNDFTGLNGSNNYVDISGNVLLTAATLNSGNYNMRIRKNFTVTPGAIFQAGTGKILFNTSGNTNLITTAGQELYDLEVEDNSASGVLQFVDDITINHNLVVNTSKIKTTTQTINIKGDFTQNGILDLGTGTVNFNGTATQNMTFTGTGNFYNLSTNKTSNHLVVSGTNNIIITNQLTLTQGNIGGRPTSKAIQVNGTISRPGLTPGHIDGALRLNFGIGAVANTTFPVGYGTEYNPMEIQLTGGGGTAGLLEVNVNADIVGGDVDATIIETGKPNGAELSSLQNIPKRWEVTANFASNTFALGARKYTANFNFISTDIRNGANTAFFEVSQRNGATNTGGWFITNTGIRTGTSVSILDNEVLPSNATQYFYGGTPANLTFYSVASGNWSNPSIWSTASYGSADLAPRAPGASDNVRIGDGKTVTLDVAHSVNASKIVIVEKAGPSNLGGYLNLGTNVISGAGTFTLATEGAIGIGDANGITTSGATGNIQTTTRNYNPSSHNNAHFIYNGTGAQETGNGLPGFVKSLVVNKSSGILNRTIHASFPQNSRQHISDSLGMVLGQLNASNINIMLKGDLVYNNNAYIDLGDRRIQDTTPTCYPNTAIADTIIRGTIGFNGSGLQIIRGTYDPDALLYLNRISILKPSGLLQSQFSLRTAQLFFHPSNRANIDVRTYNKYIVNNALTRTGTYNVLRVGGLGDCGQGDPGFDSLSVSTYGWVDGRLIRFQNSTSRQYPIGTTDRYTPVELQITTSGDGVNGLIEIQSVEGNHPNFDETEINKNTNVQKYWEITRPTGIPIDTTIFSFGTTRELRARLIYTQNEPRGGVDPSLAYTMFRHSGSSNWDSTQSLVRIIREPLETEATINDNVNIGDGVFNTPANSNPLINAIVLMVGQAGEGQEHVYYSRQDGDWEDPDTWSSEDYGDPTNDYNDYPNLATDIVNIGAANGDNHRIVLNSSVTVSSTDVVAVNGGFGILSIQGENILGGRQYVQKEGAELEIGSADGIVNKITTTPPTPSFADYTFAQSNSTYTAISGGTTPVSGNSVSDYTSPSDIPIGFTFKYLNVDYTNLRLNLDGFIGLGSSVSAVTSLPISTSAGTDPRISPLGMNLFTKSSSVVRYLSTGSAPNRVFTMQWEDVSPTAAVANTVPNYVFSNNSNTYTAITGGTVHVTGNGTADNVASNNISLPFTFNLAGTDFTAVSLNFDGFIGMGTTVSTGLTTPISSVTGSEMRIAPLGVNLFRRSNTIVRSEVTGSAPNRIFTMQWENVFPYTAEIYDEYDYTASTTTYGEITGGTVRVNATGANDTLINNIPIGFNFKFRDSTFTNISLNYDGYIAFGSSVGTATTNPLSGTTNNSNYVVSALGFEGGSLNRKAATVVRTELTGTAPNREFVIQWKSARYSTQTDNTDYNFQIRLVEGDIIRIHYGSFVCDNIGNQNVQVGLRGASNNFGNNEIKNLTVGAGWTAANVSLGTGNGDDLDLRNNRLPANGLRFQWAPNNPSYNFQVQLHETTNKVRFNYGTFTHPSGFASITSQIGMRGTTNATFNNRTTTTNWTATTAGGANNSYSNSF